MNRFFFRESHTRKHQHTQQIPATTPEGIAMRNTMHTRVKSDAFVPAGGRPNTINISNYKAFLDENTGEPCSPLIVEGANLFVTPMARRALFDEGGVLIVKDSSANKCGVITSSYVPSIQSRSIMNATTLITTGTKS